MLEYAEDGDLEKYLQRLRGRGAAGVPEHRLRNWFAQMLSAVAYMHARKFLHRDIKSANIFLCNGTCVRVSPRVVTLVAVAPDRAARDCVCLRGCGQRFRCLHPATECNTACELQVSSATNPNQHNTLAASWRHARTHSPPHAHARTQSPPHAHARTHALTLARAHRL